MNKLIKFSLLALVLLVGLSGCQNSQPKSSEQPAVDNLPTTPATATEPAPSQPIVNEPGLIEALAKYQKQGGADKYQLHDTQTKGDYAHGRFSYNNDLKPDSFWAKLAAGLWQVVYVGDQGPDCGLLVGFPPELKAGCREDLNVGQISNFADCLKAGFKATTDQPRRCLDNKNNVFLEIAPSGVAKRYISQNVIKCRNLDFDCTAEEKPFLDDLGCGCQSLPVALKTKCLANERNTQVCTLEYAPVCGWFDQSIKCLRYPCAQNYGNHCQACQNAQVVYWTKGECPK